MYCNEGDLFGLTTNDLSDQALYKLKLEKLVEFIKIDSRIKAVTAERLLTGNMCDLKIMRTFYYNENDLTKYPELCISYNKKIKNFNNKYFPNYLPSLEYLNDQYELSKQSVTYWSILDDYNKWTEYNIWAHGYNCSANFSSFKLDEVKSRDPILIDILINRFIKKTFKYTNISETLIKWMDRDLLNKYMIDIKCSPILHSYILNNTLITEDEKFYALKTLAGRKQNIPTMNISMSKEFIKRFPAVTRLKMLETVMLHTNSIIKFTDITSYTEFSELLFSTSLKYNKRVQRVVNKFKRRYSNE